MSESLINFPNGVQAIYLTNSIWYTPAKECGVLMPNGWITSDAARSIGSTEPKPPFSSCMVQKIRECTLAISRTLPPFKGEKTESSCSVGVVPGGGARKQALVGQAGLLLANDGMVRHVSDDRRPLGRPSTLGLPCT